MQLRKLIVLIIIFYCQLNGSFVNRKKILKFKIILLLIKIIHNRIIQLKMNLNHNFLKFRQCIHDLNKKKINFVVNNLIKFFQIFLLIIQ